MTKQHLQSQEVLPCLPLQDSLLPFQRPTFLSGPFMGVNLEDTECVFPHDGESWADSCRGDEEAMQNVLSEVVPEERKSEK